MTKMRLYIIIAAIAMIAMIPSCADKPAKKVGVILPLTGQYAFMGEGVRNAIEMHDLKNRSVIYEDDSCDAKKGLTSAQKLIETDGVDALITFCTSTSKAVYPLTKNAGIPQIALTETYIYEDDQLFQMMPPSFILFEQLGRIAGRLHKSVGIIYSIEDVNAGPFGNPESIRKGIEQSGSNLTVEISVVPGTKDFKTEILKIIQEKPDTLISVMFKEDHQSFLKQYAEMEAENEVQLFGSYYYEIDIESFKGLNDFTRLFNNTVSTNFKQHRTVEFVSAYREQYGSEPPIFAEYGYDAMGMIIQSMGHPNLKDAISSTAYDGAQGNLSFTDIGTIKSEVELKRFNGSEYAAG